MTKTNSASQLKASIAQDAYDDCLTACSEFEDFLGHELLRRADQVWWKETFENYPEELAQRIRSFLLEATLSVTGCFETKAPEAQVASTTPQRVHWRGRRQKVYQLIAWGLQGELPSKRSVVRHLCNNRLCIHPEHLKVGTQAQNLRDQRLSRIKDWPHQ